MPSLSSASPVTAGGLVPSRSSPSLVAPPGGLVPSASSPRLVTSAGLMPSVSSPRLVMGPCLRSPSAPRVTASSMAWGTQEPARLSTGRAEADSRGWSDLKESSAAIVKEATALTSYEHFPLHDDVSAASTSESPSAAICAQLVRLDDDASSLAESQHLLESALQQTHAEPKNGLVVNGSSAKQHGRMSYSPTSSSFVSNAAGPLPSPMPTRWVSTVSTVSSASCPASATSAGPLPPASASVFAPSRSASAACCVEAVGGGGATGAKETAQGSQTGSNMLDSSGMLQASLHAGPSSTQDVFRAFAQTSLAQAANLSFQSTAQELVSTASPTSLRPKSPLKFQSLYTDAIERRERQVERMASAKRLTNESDEQAKLDFQLRIMQRRRTIDWQDLSSSHEDREQELLQRRRSWSQTFQTRQRERDQEEMRECTFRPDTTRSTSSRSGSLAGRARLSCTPSTSSVTTAYFGGARATAARAESRSRLRGSVVGGRSAVSGGSCAAGSYGACSSRGLSCSNSCGPSLGPSGASSPRGAHDDLRKLHETQRAVLRQLAEVSASSTVVQSQAEPQGTGCDSPRDHLSRDRTRLAPAAGPEALVAMVGAGPEKLARELRVYRQQLIQVHDLERLDMQALELAPDRLEQLLGMGFRLGLVEGLRQKLQRPTAEDNTAYAKQRLAWPTTPAYKVVLTTDENGFQIFSEAMDDELLSASSPV
ncbi:unnamed protein product [Polarella glacialis]|uniref:Uncharacterized protein n=1 Tax=Polarella glacialis TaxID=89957 RepID=A0A813GHW3_POLGL|nr:unnamed protein product [Polarella glacialis]